MKNISLKLQDRVFQEAEELLKQLKISRNSYINQAIEHYNELQKRKLLAQQLKKESAMVAENSMEVLKEFEQIEDEI